MLDVFQTVIVGVAGWQVFVSGWGRMVNLLYPGWSFPATPIVSVTSEWLTVPHEDDPLGSQPHTYIVVTSFRISPDLLRMENLAPWRMEGNSINYHCRESVSYRQGGALLNASIQTGLASASGAFGFSILVSTLIPCHPPDEAAS